MLQQHLVILMVKLAVAASLASVLTRSTRFTQMLMREERTLMHRVQMALVSAAIFASGVAARVVTGSSYQAVDLGLEGSLVMGMLGGYVTGLLAGVLISIPAMFNGELMSMVLFAAAGVLGGLLRDVGPDKEAIWKLTFPDQALFRLLRKRDLRPAAFSLVCVMMILLAEFLRSSMAQPLRNRSARTTADWRSKTGFAPAPQTIALARSAIVGTRMSGWCGVSPNGRLRRSMKAVRMPAALAPMQSNAWLATNRICSTGRASNSAAFV